MNYLKPIEAAKIAQVSIQTIYRLIDVGVLDAVYPTSKTKLVLEASLSQYMRNRADPDFWTPDLKRAMRDAQKTKK